MTEEELAEVAQIDTSNISAAVVESRNVFSKSPLLAPKTGQMQPQQTSQK